MDHGVRVEGAGLDLGMSKAQLDLAFRVDAELAPRVLHVVQGQVGITEDPGIVFAAVVGSCVILCLCDPVAKVGGMAHFLFPGGEQCELHEARFGYPAMASLIGKLVKLGAKEERLQAKLFGGAKMHDGQRDVGKRNAEFAIHYLQEQKVTLVDQSLGGAQVRRIRYSPTQGISSESLLNDGMPHETLVPFGRNSNH